MPAEISKWIPQTVWGWVGLAIFAALFFFRRSLGSLVMLAGIAAGVYLYFFVDLALLPNANSAEANGAS